MSIFQSIRELDHKFSWSFFSFLLAIVLGIITLYDRVLADKHAQLYIDILSSTSVLDIREKLPNLKISYDGIDIRQKKLSLQVLTIKIINDSTCDILKGHYDPDDPIGIMVTNGDVIRTELIETSNDYLKQKVAFKTTKNSIINLKNVILDAHEFFVLKLLILHPAGKKINILPVGHISGMKSIIIRKTFQDVRLPGFWFRTFSGSWLVQVMRLPLYTLLTFFVFLLIVIPVSLISEKIQELRNRRHVKNFKANTLLKLIEDDEFIFGRYVNLGVSELLQLQNLCRNRKILSQEYNKYKRTEKLLKEKEKNPEAIIRIYVHDFYQFQLYIDSKFVKICNNKPTLNEHMTQTLEHFIQFLKNRQIINAESKPDKKLPDMTYISDMHDFE